MKILRKRNWLGQRHRTCLDCGFLAFKGKEADQDIRRTVGAEGVTGWFTDEGAVHCFKGLWDWDGDSAFNVVCWEANRPRNKCRSFFAYAPGRSPEDHLKLEDERRAFERQITMAALVTLLTVVGGLVAYILKLSN